MRLFRELLFASAALAAAFSATAGAQRPTLPSDSLPRPLVMALMAGMSGGRDMEISVGVADLRLPSDLFRDAVILGRMSRAASTVTVLQVAYEAEPASDSVKARLLRAGFRVGQSPFSGRTQGFNSSSARGMPTETMCGKEDQLLSWTATTDPARRTFVAIMLLESAQQFSFQCSAEDRDTAISAMRRGYDPLQGSPVPALPPPRGMQSDGMGSSGGGGEGGVTMHVDLTGRMSTTAVMDHYVNLFKTAGWTRIEALGGKNVSSASLEITTSDGKKWFAALSAAAATDSGLMDVQLSVRSIR